MKVTNIQQRNFATGNTPNFGHTIRVKIGIVNPDGSNYRFVNPATEKSLYKQLNSKIVRFLNENYLDRLREATNTPRKIPKQNITNQEKWQQKLLTRALTNLDSDYKDFSIVRSVYRQGKYGYIATGVDVPIIENILGATKIGKAKKDSVLYNGTTHNPYIDEIVKAFKKDSIGYAQDPINLLRNKNGKELLLELNFTPNGQKKGKETYSFFSYKFNEIQKTSQLNSNIHNILHNKSNIFEYIKKTIKHNLDKLSAKTDLKEKDIKEIMRSHAFDIKPAPKKSKSKTKDNPAQLTFDFKD